MGDHFRAQGVVGQRIALGRRRALRHLGGSFRGDRHGVSSRAAPRGTSGGGSGGGGRGIRLASQSTAAHRISPAGGGAVFLRIDAVRKTGTFPRGPNATLVTPLVPGPS